MKNVLHINSGDCSGGNIAKCGVPGDVFVWHDIMYEGPRKPGWPSEATLHARAAFLEQATGGGLRREYILNTLEMQYRRLDAVAKSNAIVLWFDACLFDQSMLAHILMCLQFLGVKDAELLCVDAFPGIEPYDGLGQLQPSQLASVYDRRHPVTAAQFDYAAIVDRAFALQDQAVFQKLSRDTAAPLPWVPAAVARWLKELPDPVTGLGRLEQLALDAIHEGRDTPAAIFKTVSARETRPQYWGDSTLWAKINGLADRRPPLVRIAGPTPRLPQWEGVADLRQFRITGIAR